MRQSLGLDVGGTQTRWAVMGPGESVIAQGSVAGFSAMQLDTEAGQNQVSDLLASLAVQVAACGGTSVMVAGVTGFGSAQDRRSAALRALLVRHLQMAPEAVRLSSDIELACLAAFEPGQGYLVYAGTGSIAGFVDERGEFHRAGGRGGILDDGGSGYWITLEALRKIWRIEDERPGAWVDSAMAVTLFEAIGGSDWSLSRELVYGASRGRIGQLAMVVAASVDQDPGAGDILRRSGYELARLGNAMLSRFGTRPLVLGGRVAQLHPLIELSMRERLPPGCDLRQLDLQAHVAAARMALGSFGKLAVGSL